ncbi:enoyl-CoA hydratase/isomerase family protein [Roseibium polysiphoniae]|uniref:enoyl-CoA hydratase/isomerase family protein n=1 Tax=Roseibium polysiphoniae TaxID=2571221 RepID=UPI001FEB7C7E|nr:enoyl-CoA hydratase/isomerase family protein [Roseibium polysiphoniae]
MTDDILFEQRGFAGVVTLNRPKALNALNHPMVTALTAKLTEWAGDDSIRHVVLIGAGEKAFCAGGDIRKIYDMKRAGETGLPEFFRDEYLLNAQIKAFPKPYISLIDGIVMGGGVGLSAHGSHRVGTEFTMFAMPETGIGFFPDVGGTFFLPRMPRFTGTYCAMSAGRLKQADAYETGVLTHTIHRDSVEPLLKALETTDDVDAAIEACAVDAGASELMKQADLIEAAFSAGSVSAIMDRLDASGDEFAAKTAAAIRSKSPTSVHLAFEQMRRGASLDFNGCMKLEYRIVSQVLQGHDFFEGVRAVLVDKDHAPKWQPDQLDQVDSADLQAYFEEPSTGDLPLT